MLRGIGAQGFASCVLRRAGLSLCQVAVLLCGPGPLVAQAISVATPITYPSPITANYDAGSGPVHRITVTTSGFGSGAPGYYQVRMRALATTLGNGKPVGHVRFMRPCGTGGSSTGCDSWATLGTSYQNILPSHLGDLTFSVDFQVTSWSWTADSPFDYEVTLDFHAYNDAGGKNAYATPAFRIKVNPLLSVTLDNSTLVLASTAVADFNTGWVQAGNTTSITTKANVAHMVQIKAATSSFGSTNALALIPASDLQWSTNVSGSWSGWASLATSGATVVSRSAGNYVTPFAVRHRQLLDWGRTLGGKHTLKVDYAVQQQ